MPARQYAGISGEANDLDVTGQGDLENSAASASDEDVGQAIGVGQWSRRSGLLIVPFVVACCILVAVSVFGTGRPRSRVADSIGRDESHPLVPSDAPPLQEFYTYRAAAEGETDKYPFGNVNTANLDGVIWYLMNEIVTKYTDGTRCPRRFNISKIHRYKILARATQELVNGSTVAGYPTNFGARFAYDQGSCTGRCFQDNECTGTEDCDYHYEKYGFIVGCNNFRDHYPFPDYDTPAPGGIWYSLPLEGRCDYPTGALDCTWSYEDAGELDLEELEATSPGWGHGNCCNGMCTNFWENQFEVWATDNRVRKAKEMFDQKYPESPSGLSAPRCDFNPWAWYAKDDWPRRDPWATSTETTTATTAETTTAAWSYYGSYYGR